jgi:hypothetical protein
VLRRGGVGVVLVADNGVAGGPDLVRTLRAMPVSMTQMSRAIPPHLPRSPGLLRLALPSRRSHPSPLVRARRDDLRSATPALRRLHRLSRRPAPLLFPRGAMAVRPPVQATIVNVAVAVAGLNRAGLRVQSRFLLAPVVGVLAAAKRVAVVAGVVVNNRQRNSPRKFLSSAAARNAKAAPLAATSCVSKCVRGSPRCRCLRVAT